MANHGHQASNRATAVIDDPIRPDAASSRGRPAPIPGGGMLVMVAILMIALVVEAFVPGTPEIIGVHVPLIFSSYAAVGSLIIRREGANTVGWLLAVMGFAGLMGTAAEVVAARSLASGLLLEVASWVKGWYFFAFLGGFLPLFHVFPSGRSLPGGWRWGYRLAATSSIAMVVGFLFGPFDDGTANPFEVAPIAALQGVLFAILPLALLMALALGVASLSVRFRRARHRERDQLKWMFWGTGVAALLFLVQDPLVTALPDPVGEALGSIAFILPGAAIAIAIIRHRLYDIDRLVSRTVTYLIVGIVVAVAYAAPVVVLPAALGFSGNGAVAGATLTAAAAFNPLRRRVQHRVDRRFNRARYDASQVLDAVAVQIRSITDRTIMAAEVGAAVGIALNPRSIAIWLGPPARNGGGTVTTQGRS